MDKWIFILEFIGIIVFAISGSMEAMKANMDLLGVIILAVITSTGGGVIRDLILGITPPNAFANPLYIHVAIVVSVITFGVLYYNKKILEHNVTKTVDKGLLLFDAMGLAVFTVVGMNIAYDISKDYSTTLYVFVGLISGVGGGMMRDILTGNVPYILDRNVYASAAIIGAMLDVVLRYFISDQLAMILSALVIFTIRMAAAKRGWNLPKVAGD